MIPIKIYLFVFRTADRNILLQATLHIKRKETYLLAFLFWIPIPENVDQNIIGKTKMDTKLFLVIPAHPVAPAQFLQLLSS